jgi:primosomal protein N'
VIIDIYESINTDYDETKIKSIISIKNSDSLLSNYRVELAKWISRYYFTAIHNSINLFFPKNLKEKILKNKVPPLKHINSTLD